MLNESGFSCTVSLDRRSGGAFGPEEPKEAGRISGRNRAYDRRLPPVFTGLHREGLAVELRQAH